MNFTIRLTKVEYEMLKELQKNDKRYKNGIELKVKSELKIDYAMIIWSNQINLEVKDSPQWMQDHPYLTKLNSKYSFEWVIPLLDDHGRA